jgi:hypothetical protein
MVQHLIRLELHLDKPYWSLFVIAGQEYTVNPKSGLLEFH